MSKKIIIFDMDGVLIDSINLMLKLNQSRFPGSNRKDLELLFTGNIHEQIDNLKESYGAGLLSEEEQEKRRKSYTQEKTQTVQMYQGVFELLGELKEKDYQLSVNTSASDANTFDLLNRLGIREFFDHIVTRDITRSKVEKFHILAEKHSCNISDFLFVTDSLGDLKESHELDIPTIAVSWGVHGREYFKKEEYPNLIEIVDSVSDLQSLLVQ